VPPRVKVEAPIEPFISRHTAGSIQPAMPTALVFNPGSNSLKFELVECSDLQKIASEAKKLASAALDGVGKDARLSVYEGRKVVSEEDANAGDMREAVSAALAWLRKQDGLTDALEHLAFAGVRVVHGGTQQTGTTRATPEVRSYIAALEDLAPLHNESSLDVLGVLDTELPGVSTFVTFDTAFHRTLPEKAWRYPIERETTDRHGVRKFGFHGVSHRYMLEQYAATVGRNLEEIDLVTLHLESGSSACAIQRGRSVDTTMGMTPLEGLMMGSRSGSIDPAIVPFLMRKENKSAEDVLALLNKKSGLLGIAGGSLDTRELVKRKDDAARLALEMFSYRVRLAVGAYLAALGTAEAVLFGGGIGEDSPWLREAVCAGLSGWGLELDSEANQSQAGMRRITKEASRLHAWAFPVEEGLQIAHECMQALLHERQ
jgi:acetate kinase